MTNETIFKSLECCAGTSPCTSDNCPLWNEPACQQMLAQAILDNIENGELVSGEWHDEQVLHAENVIEEQKAEIEKLLCKNAELEVRCEGVLKDYYTQSKTCDEQRLEIERLGRRNGEKIIKIDDLEVKVMDLEKEKDELQKQVDELTDKLGKVLSGIKADELLTAKGIEQAIKDTAKKILQELWDETEPLTESHKWVRLRIKNIASRKGVEVE